MDDIGVALSTGDVKWAPPVLVFQRERSSVVHKNLNHLFVLLRACKHKGSPADGLIKGQSSHIELKGGEDYSDYVSDVTIYVNPNQKHVC